MKIAVAAAAFTVALPLTATVSGAAGLSCGQVVTESIVLTADLGPCPGDGLVVGADNVTIDLNGHTLVGTANGGRYGVWAKGRTGVVVENGQVTGFDVGVTIEGGSHNTVQQVVAHDNVGDFRRSNFGSGVVVLESDDNVIQDNRAFHNGPLAGIEVVGVALGNVVQRNDVSSNEGLMPLGASEDKGISVRGLSSARTPAFTTIQFNRVVANGHVGIFVGGYSNDNRVLNNLSQGNGHVFNHRNEQAGAGIEVGPRAQRNLVQGNAVYDSGGDGFLLRAALQFPPVPLRNQILGNTFLQSDRFHGVNSFPALDIQEQNRACGGNTYRDNRYQTANIGGSECVN